tara:strand:- start:282 stop:989 length:708 start_codon:yes stop_codon:yes gene_type:complete
MYKSIIIIPCYNVKDQILNVIKKINLKNIFKVIVVDDFCPQETGKLVEKKVRNNKIKVLYSKKNLGVGGAFKLGLNFAKQYNPNQVIKIDGDGQHDPKFIEKFINLQKKYPNRMVKGRREMSFFLTKIPFKRFIGNNLITLIIRFITKNSQLNDVVNGFISLPKNIISKINFKYISSDFFFEQDLLISITKKKFKVNEILISTKYFDQKSNLSEIKVILPFLKRYLLIIFGFYNI